MFSSGQDRNIITDFRKNIDSGHRIFIKSVNCMNQTKSSLVFIRGTKNLPFYFFKMIFQSVDVIKVLPEFSGLFRGKGSVNSSLYFSISVLYLLLTTGVTSNHSSGRESIYSVIE